MNESVYNHLLTTWTSLIAVGIILSWRKRFVIRRWWVRKDLKEEERNFYGAYKRLFSKYKHDDHEQFEKFVGMSVRQFNYLHRKVKSKLCKDVFCIRRRLGSQIKLAAVLK